jgi:hypothetical protein
VRPGNKSKDKFYTGSRHESARRRAEPANYF